MTTFGNVANALAASAGKTKGEMILAMTQAAFPPVHPEVLFATWMEENQGQIRDACTDLGIDPPEPGPHLYQRLKDAVIPVLEKRRK